LLLLVVPRRKKLHRLRPLLLKLLLLPRLLRLRLKLLPLLRPRLKLLLLLRLLPKLRLPSNQFSLIAKKPAFGLAFLLPLS
jgi:hypothetical protein